MKMVHVASIINATMTFEGKIAPLTWKLMEKKSVRIINKNVSHFLLQV